MLVVIISVLIGLLYFVSGRYYAGCKSDSKLFNDFKDFVGGLNLKDDKVLTGLVGSIYHSLGGTSKAGLSVVRVLVFLMYFHNSGLAAVYGLISLFVQGYQSFDQDQVSGQVDEEAVEIIVDTDDLGDEDSEESVADEELVDEDSEEVSDDSVVADSDEVSDEDVLG